MSDPTHGRIRHGGSVLLAIAALAAAIAGCGAGSGSPDESEARQKLEAGGQKLTGAKSFEVSLQIEAEEEESDPEELGCVDLGVDNHQRAAIDMRIYDLNCSGGSEGKELIAIGHRAWASTEPGRYTAARISPQLTKELNEEQATDLKGLFAAAEDVRQVTGDTAVEERAAGGEPTTEFRFKAPASAFPDAEDLGDTDVEFEATLDQKGFLRELTLHGEAEGVGATVTETYEDIDSDLGFTPPDPTEVHGTVQQLRTRENLDALLGDD